MARPAGPKTRCGDEMKNYDLEKIEIMIERVAPDQLARAIEVFGDMRFAHLSVSESIEIVLDEVETRS